MVKTLSVSTSKRELRCITSPIWKALCQQCDWKRLELSNPRAAQNAAKAHGAVHRHDVEIRFSVIDQLAEVIRVRDGRD